MPKTYSLAWYLFGDPKTTISMVGQLKLGLCTWHFEEMFIDSFMPVGVRVRWVPQAIRLIVSAINLLWLMLFGWSMWSETIGRILILWRIFF